MTHSAQTVERERKPVRPARVQMIGMKGNILLYIFITNHIYNDEKLAHFRSRPRDSYCMPCIVDTLAYLRLLAD